MSANELYEHAAEGKRHMGDQPVLVASQVEDNSVVADKVDGCAELSFYLGGTAPACL
jgi:hypothetical protein